MKKIILAISILCMVGCVSSEQSVVKEMPVTQLGSQGAGKLFPIEELPVFQIVEEIKEREKFFSLSVNNMELRNVFFILSKELSEYNIVLDPDVRGAVTTSFRDLPLEKVLAILLEPLGFEYVMEDNIIRVSKPRRETRVFEFVYSTATRVSNSTLKAVTGSGGSGSSGSSSGGGSSDEAASSFDSIESSESVTVWDELESGIRELLSNKGILGTNRRTGRITITDYRSNLKLLEEFIAFFKREAMRQIHIKAKILEVTLTDGSEFGIDWGYAFKIGSNSLGLTQDFTTATGGTILDRFEGFSDVVTGTVDSVSGDLDVLVNALEVQGNVKVLSSPQVTTLNGQMAIIRSITEDVVFQQKTNNTSGGITVSVTADPFTYGVFLGVTPHADSEGTITMDIHPSVSSLVTVAAFPQADPQARRPIIDTRETQTVVSVKDKEVVIIAGLMQDDVRESISKFPILGDIPYLGKMFRREVKTSEKTELVVLLSPTIVGHSAKDFGTIRDKFKHLEKSFSSAQVNPIK